MSYYDQAVMMQLKLGTWDTTSPDKPRRPSRSGDRRPETKPLRTRFFSF